MIKVANNVQAMLIKQAAKKNKVDYTGRALRGALFGLVPGALGSYAVTTSPSLGEALGLRSDPAKVLVPLLLGGGIGALGNVASGIINQDIIEGIDPDNKPTPDFLTRGTLGGILGGLYGAAYGGPLAHPIAGFGLGATLGAGTGLITPLLNPDMFKTPSVKFD